MDADRSDESLNGLDVDRELQSLLAADPSPEFVARLRTRIANEPEPAAWWWSWTFASAIVAAAVIVLAVAIGRSGTIDAPGPAAPHTLTSVALPNATTTTAALKGRPYISTETERHPPLAHVGRPVDGRRQEESVLLDPRETAALRALILGVRKGDVDLAPILRASVPSAMELPPVAELAIPPITIDPLVEEGVRP